MAATPVRAKRGRSASLAAIQKTRYSLPVMAGLLSRPSMNICTDRVYSSWDWDCTATSRIAQRKGYYFEVKAGRRYLWCVCGRSGPYKKRAA